MSITDLLFGADELHTLCSLAGFEALLRGCHVVTYGTPFYAGWGLTEERGPRCPRRQRTLTLDELVAGCLILYPLYVDPHSRQLVNAETVIETVIQHCFRIDELVGGGVFFYVGAGGCVGRRGARGPLGVGSTSVHRARSVTIRTGAAAPVRGG
ncbi:MAG: capsular polysaccharide export protein, LipB/KpsS family [Brachybacterium sp.]